ncbi:DUF2963 domain-containing protein, partial ['Chrysanthemum coronarium' phytoplasma]
MINKTTIYYRADKTIDYIFENDKETGYIIKKTQYQSDGTNIDYVSEYDKDTGQEVKVT